MTSRGLSDDALLARLAGFLAYETRGGAVMDFAAWADAGHFTDNDRTLLEVCYMGTLMAQWPES